MYIIPKEFLIDESEYHIVKSTNKNPKQAECCRDMKPDRFGRNKICPICFGLVLPERVDKVYK
jgi:hypothetical protein